MSSTDDEDFQSAESNGSSDDNATHQVSKKGGMESLDAQDHAALSEAFRLVVKRDARGLRALCEAQNERHGVEERLRGAFRDSEKGSVRVVSGDWTFWLDHRSAEGHTPLCIAAFMRDHSCVRVLLEVGHASPIRRSSCGWSPLMYATSTCDHQLAGYLYLKQALALGREYFNLKVPQVILALEDLPDFYVEVSWSFRSWIPLVSRLAPSDTYKIWKRGSSVRVDGSLVGFQGRKWKRGDISVLFCGREGSERDSSSSRTRRAGDLLMVNHQQKAVEGALKTMEESSREEIEEAMRKILRLGRLDKAKTRTDAMVAEKNKNRKSKMASLLGKGSSATEKVAGFQAEVHVLNNVDFDVQTRNFTWPTERPGPDEILKYLPDAYLPDSLKGQESEARTPSSQQFDSLQQPFEKQSVTTHSFSGIKAWMVSADDFGHSISSLVPAFQAISPTLHHFKKLLEVLPRLPDGFPVKLEIPVFPTVRATVEFRTFIEFKNRKPTKHRSGHLNDAAMEALVESMKDPELFSIPSDYKDQRVKFAFDELLDDKVIDEVDSAISAVKEESSSKSSSDSSSES